MESEEEIVKILQEAGIVVPAHGRSPRDSLPGDSDPAWKLLDTDALIADVQAKLDVFDLAAARYLKKTVNGPAARLADSRHEAVFAELDRADLLAEEAMSILIALRFDVNRTPLRRFFRSAVSRVPTGVPPPEVYMPVAFAIFRSHYHLMRSLLISYNDPSRQSAWNFAPVGVDPETGLVTPSRNNMSYSRLFGSFFDKGYTLFEFVFVASPLCDRMARDASLIDVMAKIVLSWPSGCAVFGQDDWIGTLKRDDSKKELLLTVLCGSLLTVGTLKDRRGTPLAGAAAESIERAAEFMGRVVELLEREGVEIATSLVAQIKVSILFLRGKLPADLGWKPGDQPFEGPNRCDSCDRTAAEAGCKLQRCARCHVRMYCSSECAEKDWKEGTHKRNCFKASGD